MQDVTLLEFATHWDWRGNKYTRRGKQGGLLYIVGVCQDTGQILMMKMGMKIIVMLK